MKGSSKRKQEEWGIATLLMTVFKGDDKITKCIDSSRRLSAQGVSLETVKGLVKEMDSLNTREKRFLESMVERNFSSEQILSYLASPRVVSNYNDSSRDEIAKTVSKEWSRERKKPLAVSVELLKSSSSLVFLAGIVSCVGTLAVGYAVGNVDLQVASKELATYFPQAIGFSMDAISGKLAGSVFWSVLGAGAFNGIKMLSDLRKIRRQGQEVNLSPILSQATDSGSISRDHTNYRVTKKKLELIPVSHRNLLTHLTGPELRLFLHGSDEVRRKILSVRTPTHGQRLAMIMSTDKSFLYRLGQSLVLPGSAWKGVLASGPATLEKSLQSMRESRKSKKHTDASLGPKATLP